MNVRIDFLFPPPPFFFLSLSFRRIESYPGEYAPQPDGRKAGEECLHAESVPVQAINTAVHTPELRQTRPRRSREKLKGT